MKAAVTILAAILAVSLWGVIQQRNTARDAERERVKQDIAECWETTATDGGDAGIALCQSLEASVK